ncbi:hypothetical protein FHX77_000613 [Bifidobacterium commune]|uniref:Uncharacterized protein n=1 Tax=Bifidobacterium commune TaxID=1505727 RepID=A0A1C4H086_9BIFI|nr:hypothetical protein [Bifidobacterium commune]MBB2955210.1 hypothetical protein [Bifidobacterium commune]SCC78172.1 hypothetical protein GA0061077_0134 [Bifidobacterium commune]
MGEYRDDGQDSDKFDDAENNENDNLFSDDELDAALAGFEKEFTDDAEDPSAQSDRSVTDELDRMDFDEELAGLIGNKAKVAVLITRLISADLLAAFCQISDISADCVADKNGAVAILRNLDGDAPESAAKDLTNVVSGMPAVLSVNRADKLVSTLYMAGEPGQKFAPPVLFATTPECVEDLMLGITNVAALRSQGTHVVSTADFDREKAIRVIADYTHPRGRGKSSIG